MAATRTAVNRRALHPTRAGVLALVAVLALLGSAACTSKGGGANAGGNKPKTTTPTENPLPSTSTPPATFDGTPATLRQAGPTDQQMQSLFQTCEPQVLTPTDTSAAFWPNSPALAKIWENAGFKGAMDFSAKCATTQITTNVSVFATEAGAARAAAAWETENQRAVRSKIPGAHLTIFTVQGRAHEKGFTFPLNATSSGVYLYDYEGPILIHIQGLGPSATTEGQSFGVFNDTYANVPL